MRVLLDYSQIVISSTIELYSRKKEEGLSIDLFRHIALNNILAYKKMFSVRNKDLIICFDSRNYWRKKLFPQYKQNRRISQDKSPLDWDLFYDIFNKIKHEIREELPFPVIEVEGTEADDIIAVLCMILCPSEDHIIIVSSDKDLIQIQENICVKVKQYSPFHKKYINKKTNEYDLFNHIVRGDSGDGIPNILSPDNVFLTEGIRSKAIRQSSIRDWEKQGGICNPENFCKDSEMLRRFIMNRQLIDLTQIPIRIVKSIREGYDAMESYPDRNVFNYLVEHKLTKILAGGSI